MAVASTLTQLENVQTAIAAIESGAQSYQFGDIRVTKANLSALYQREAELLARYAREQRGSSRIRPNWSDGI